MPYPAPHGFAPDPASTRSGRGHSDWSGMSTWQYGRLYVVQLQAPGARFREGPLLMLHVTADATTARIVDRQLPFLDELGRDSWIIGEPRYVGGGFLGAWANA